MTLTIPSATIIKTIVDPLQPFGTVMGAVAFPGKLNAERWRMILCILAHLDNVDDRLIALRELCDTYRFNYGTIFAMVATYGPLLL